MRLHCRHRTVASTERDGPFDVASATSLTTLYENSSLLRLSFRNSLLNICTKNHFSTLNDIRAITVCCDNKLGNLVRDCIADMPFLGIEGERNCLFSKQIIFLFWLRLRKIMLHITNKCDKLIMTHYSRS